MPSHLCVYMFVCCMCAVRCLLSDVLFGFQRLDVCVRSLRVDLCVINYGWMFVSGFVFGCCVWMLSFIFRVRILRLDSRLDFCVLDFVSWPRDRSTTSLMPPVLDKVNRGNGQFYGFLMWPRGGGERLSYGSWGGGRFGQPISAQRGGWMRAVVRLIAPPPSLTWNAEYLFTAFVVNDLTLGLHAGQLTEYCKDSQDEKR